jgi:hypothetical protein
LNPARYRYRRTFPVRSRRYISGELKITQEIDKKHVSLYQAKDDYRGRWLDFKVQVRFSPSVHGRIKVSLGDNQLVDFGGITANSKTQQQGTPVQAISFSRWDSIAIPCLNRGRATFTGFMCEGCGRIALYGGEPEA